MDKSRRCSSNKETKSFGECEAFVSIGETIPRKLSPHGSAIITPMSVEQRGITYRQLYAIFVNIERRCIKEKWKGRDDNL
jgi:hypothetical protein